MIENSTGRMDTHFVQTRQECMRRSTDPRFKGSMILGEDLTVAFLAKKEERLNQLWAVGKSILELSKAHMIKLFYKDIRPLFNGKATILVSDTDSYVTKLAAPTTDHAISVLKQAKLMDTSNYPKDHFLYDESNKNVPGLLKNETPGDDLVECVGVRSKVYAIRSENMFDSRCKGVRKANRKRLLFDDFKSTVLGDEPKVVTVTQHMLQSKNHQNRLMELSKTAMTSFDDKRYLGPCGIHTFPYGSKLIELCEKQGKCFYCDHPRVYS